MQSKTLKWLAGATVVMVGIAVASTLTRPGSFGTESRGQAVFGGLAEKANELSSIIIDAGDWQAELKKQGEQFIDASGYPVRLEPIRSIITGMATLTYEEAKTADPDRYAELELAEPGPDSGAGRLVRLMQGDNEIASLVVGERDLTVGGMRGGMFARLPGNPQSWLLRGAVELPNDRGELFDAQLLALNNNDIGALTVADEASGQQLSMMSSAPGDPLVLAGPEPATDAAKVLELQALVNNLQFADVRPARADVPVIGSVQYQTRDGLSVTIERLRVDEADIKAEVFGWARLKVAVTDNATDKAREHAKSLRARTEGYDFAFYQSAFDTINGGVAALLKPAAEG